jgi:hypothetical protein
MALDQSALLEVLEALKAAEVDDRIRQAAETIYQALIEAELASVIGALPHERTGTRTAHRNGHQPRVLASTAGDLELRIPKLCSGSFFPSLLERRRRVDQSLFAVIMEAYLHGTSTRKVDDLVKALGADSGISKSEVSRICADLDTEVAAFRDRTLAGQAFRYVFLDATYCKARVDHRVVSQAVVVATGGHREVLGFEVGDSEDGAFWTALLRSLKTRGLAGVQLVSRGLRPAGGGSVFTWGRNWISFRMPLTRSGDREVLQGVVDGGEDWQPLVQSADPHYFCHLRPRGDQAIAAPFLVGVVGDLDEGAEPPGVAEGQIAQIEQQQPGMGEGGTTLLSEAVGGGQIKLFWRVQDLDLAAAFPRRVG